jgi:hypothetical protein
MPVCVYSMFVLSSVDSGLATGQFSVQGVLPSVFVNKKLKKNGQIQQSAVESLIIIKKY